jgi:hypothetical protein
VMIARSATHFFGPRKRLSRVKNGKRVAATLLV